jgi:hypothetical protein
MPSRHSPRSRGRAHDHRGQLDTIKEWLPVYFDPSRKPAVFGPGAPMVSQAVIERAIGAIAPRALKPAG